MTNAPEARSPKAASQSLAREYLAASTQPPASAGELAKSIGLKPVHGQTPNQALEAAAEELVAPANEENS